MAQFLQIESKISFDVGKIFERMEKKDAKVLLRTAGYTRKVMRGRMRRRKAVSAPGDYPSAHDGRLKELIFFDIDTSNKSYIVGPRLLPDKNQIRGGKTVPQLVNEGGTVPGYAVDKKQRRKVTRIRRGKQHYRERPFVALTLPDSARVLAENMENIDL